LLHLLVQYFTNSNSSAKFILAFYFEKGNNYEKSSYFTYIAKARNLSFTLSHCKKKIVSIISNHSKKEITLNGATSFTHNRFSLFISPNNLS